MKLLKMILVSIEIVKRTSEFNARKDKINLNKIIYNFKPEWKISKKFRDY